MSQGELALIQSMGLSKEQYEDILRLIVDKKNGISDIDWIDIVEQYNLSISKDTLRKCNDTIFGGSFVYQYLQNNQIETCNRESDSATETSINKDGTVSSKKNIKMSEENSKDANYVLKAHGFDPTLWKIVSVRNTIRQAISQQDGVCTLYASFLTVKPFDDDEIPFAKWEEWFNKLDRNYSLPKVKPTKEYLDGDKCLLIDIADLHLNLAATLFTTGNEYNCEIAKKLFFNTLQNIISRTTNYNFAKVIFCIGGDMLNGDNLKGSTTKGTPQDNDLHYYDANEIMTAMTIKAIDLLKESFKCKVDVIYIVGNHDEITGFQLAKYVDAWYRNDINVNVDYKPLPRKYYIFGKSLLVFSHNGNIKKLPALIADEAREYWSSINTTDVFLQHLHTESVLLEENNMRIQRLPTISAKSKWSNDGGLNSKRQCKTFIYDLEDGLTDILYTYIK
jgi:hypothetical protein